MFRAKRLKYDHKIRSYVIADEWVEGHLIKEGDLYVIITGDCAWQDGSEWSIEDFEYVDEKTIEFLNKF